MADIQTSQNLLHRLALYGSGLDISESLSGAIRPLSSPAVLNEELIRMSPSAAHKVGREDENETALRMMFHS